MKVVFTPKPGAVLSPESMETLMRNLLAMLDVEVHLERGDLSGSAKVEYEFKKEG